MLQLFNVDVPREALPLLENVFASKQLADGAVVAEFEKKLGAYTGNNRVISTSSASGAVMLALYIAGVRPGDDVLATPLACLATNMPALNLFANVIWCDLDATGNIDPAEVQRKITKRTKALLYAPWAGNTGDVQGLMDACSQHGIALVQDASEGLGAEYDGRKLGNDTADFTIFSFYPNKLITTGEGGAIAFKNPQDFEKARWLKRYGIHQPTFRDPLKEIDPASDIPVAGYCEYMNNITAAIGVPQFDNLERKFQAQHANGQAYDRALAEVPGVQVIPKPDNSKSAYWVYTFLVDDRDGLLKYLREKEIYASKVHLRNDYYSSFGPRAKGLLHTDEFEKRYISVPSGWWLKSSDIEYIIQAIKSYYSK
jgi:dTDP-4-amino-4,6-dideoxygalactose transaminase